MKCGNFYSGFLLFLAGVFITGQSPYDKGDASIKKGTQPYVRMGAFNPKHFAINFRGLSSERVGEGETFADHTHVDSIESLWRKIKSNFLEGPLCRPDKVINNPSERLNPLLHNLAVSELAFLSKSDSWTTKEWRLNRFRDFAQHYHLGSEVLEYGLGLIEKLGESQAGRFETLVRLRGEVIKDMNLRSKIIPDYMSETILEELLAEKIFIEDDKGEIHCPFVGLEAFRRAMLGREKVMQSLHRSSISKPDLLTIVDFTRPSNERRMFVIDLANKVVKINTWVAHGGGTTKSSREQQEAGIDGFGSSPTTTNEKHLSFEGFYIASSTYDKWDNAYGPNVSFKGIDLQGATGAKVLHGWRTPFNAYNSGPWVWNSSSGGEGKRVPPKDELQGFLKHDFKNEDVDVLFETTSEFTSLARPSPLKRMETTNGCLGVPDNMVTSLQKELKGSLMLNYSGVKMKSKW